MVQEFKAYRTSDGAVLHTQGEAVHHELALIVLDAVKDVGGNCDMAIANAIVEKLKRNDSAVCGLLKQFRDCTPRPVHATLAGS